MNFQRYLSAKRTVDERAIDRGVEARLAEELRGRDAPDRDALCVLEVGSGIGSTVTRLLDRSWFPDRVDYTALDIRSENVAAARERLPSWAAARGFAVRRAGESADGSADGSARPRARADDRFVLSRGQRRAEVRFRTADAFDFLAETDREFDLVVAHAFVDLVDPADALAAFRRALAPDGLAYCPITFDGETGFDPVSDPDLEARLLDTFHRHLDASGDSRAGRHLLATASATGEVLAAAGSDWVVYPRDGGYPADEAYFLDCIVEMVAGAVRKEGKIDAERVAAWADRRREQITDAKLVYCAHQLDLLVR
ncbi:class I SAM-dependent methyltransferase [Halorussus gelatinilyticus]|uniref:Class I SAM-dependent methyltransferase n=1 Tax=Halorussus gelatinilyticus TaxID=2937524 RepID=A0A8U0IDM7_9EURY|nr:class I SAM-dependent methyltransferase [Halorussus gelatinilyticus]UPV98874.1 class I SAM-dependent methyltransferase [Halorussus gelatinilyticus]